MLPSVSATSDAARAAPGERPVARVGPLLLALAPALLFSLPVLDPGVQLFYRDTLRLYYPVKRFIAQELAQGRVPLWDPWTESGASLLGQVSPGLLHPFTLLYALLPFDLAFKLNHLLALPLAAAGAYVLSRRLGCGRPAAAVAGAVFSSSGALLSVTASNLPYALGAATLPWAISGALWLCERPSAARMLGAAAALALCVYAGEPQSALFGGLLGGLLAVALEEPSLHPDAPMAPRAPRPARRALLCAAWGAVALLLAAPVLLPGALRLTRSSRWSGLAAEDRAAFELHPARLLGALVPRAFDNLTVEGPLHEPAAFADYFSRSGYPFIDSTGLGAPALLLALLAALRSRHGKLVASLALLFALGACGRSLGVYALFERLPVMGLFRYAEKLLLPSALLAAIAAGLGAQLGLAGSKRAAGQLAAAAAGLGGTLLALRLSLWLWRGPLELWLLARGAHHDPRAPAAFTALLGAGLVTAAALCTALSLVALHRWLSPRSPALSALLAACCCLAASLTSGADLLLTAPQSLLTARPPLLEELERRAGPSEGRWRALFDNTEALELDLPGQPDQRVRSVAASVKLLRPQLDALSFESAQAYFSLSDPAYAAALSRSTLPLARLFGVRFLTTFAPRGAEAPAAQRLPYLPPGLTLRELETGPRAFFVERVVAAPPGHSVDEVFGDPAFDPRQAAVVTPEIAALLSQAGLQRGPAEGAAAATYARSGPGELRVGAETDVARLLVIGEHFDPGWSALVDGNPAPVVDADGLALGVLVPAGEHQVVVRFRPRGLVPGLWLAALALVSLAAAAAVTRRAR